MALCYYISTGMDAVTAFKHMHEKRRVVDPSILNYSVVKNIALQYPVR